MPLWQVPVIEEAPERRQVGVVLLLASLAYLPLLGYLSWQINGFLALVLCLRFAAIRWPGATPGRLALFALTVVGALNCVLVYHDLPGKTAGAALFATMLGLKLLELKGRRDCRVVAILIGFLVVVQFLFDQSLGLAVWLAAVLLGALLLLVDLNGGFSAPSWKRSARIVIRMALEATPIAAALFLLFPRLTSPLWDLGVDRSTGVTGLTDRLAPGAISELVINGELAFRARFDEPPPRAALRYWRGVVLWNVDESGWSPGLDPTLHRGDGALAQGSDHVDYEVVLEPSSRRWMFALDMPTELPEGGILSADFQLVSDSPITAPKRYRMRSALEYRTFEPQERIRRAALRLPSSVTHRMRQLARGWREDAANDWAVVEAGLRHFRREAFSYTLLPPPLGENPTDEFLFVTRSGFCEHYASSFALLMRIAEVPSRIVIGYLGGEPNQLGGHYMVWQSDAHAWVEVLISGRGWVRVDPTAAVAPERIDNRSAAQMLGRSASVRFQLGSENLLARGLRGVRDLADSLDAAWQDWVLDYRVEHQRSLLVKLGLGAFGESALVGLMLVAVAVGLGGVLLGLRRSGQWDDPVARAYSEFCSRMAAAGVVRAEWEGPQEFGRRIAAHRPDLAAQVSEILVLYEHARYAGLPTAAGGPILSRLVSRFRPRRGR